MSVESYRGLPEVLTQGLLIGKLFMWTGRTANPRTKNLDFRGSGSRVCLIVRGGTPRSIGGFPET